MNRFWLLTVVISTVSMAAFAQVGTNSGFVLFNNSKVAAPVLFADGKTKINNANYVAQLFYSTDGTSFTALGSTAAFSALAAKAGYWSGNTKNLQFPDSIHDDQPLTLKVAIWDSTVFPSWDAAVAAALNPGTPFRFQIGSETFSYTTPAVGNLSPDAAYIKNFRSFELTEYISPEPSVVALSVVGIGLLFWRGRPSSTPAG